MIGNKDGVRPDCFYDQSWEYAFAATRYDFDPLAVVDLVFQGSFGMDLDKRLRTLLNKKADPSRLIA